MSCALIGRDPGGLAIHPASPPTKQPMVVAFRRHTPPPLHGCIHASQPSIPHPTRSALHHYRPPPATFAVTRKVASDALRHDPRGDRDRAPAHQPWTEGLVERMTRTIRQATVKRFHHESHDRLRTRLVDPIQQMPDPNTWG